MSLKYLIIIRCAWLEPFNNNSVQSRDIMGKRALLHLDTMAVIYNSHSVVTNRQAVKSSEIRVRTIWYSPMTGNLYLCLDSYSTLIIITLCLNIILYYLVLNNIFKDMTGSLNYIIYIVFQNEIPAPMVIIWSLAMQSCQKIK